MQVLILSKDGPTRNHLRRLLERCPHVAGVAESAGLDTSSEEGDRLWEGVDAIVADVCGGARGVVGTIRGISDAYPRARLLALGGYRDSRFAVRALQAGANGYVLMERSSEDLCEALETVEADHVYVSPGIAGVTGSPAGRRLGERDRRGRENEPGMHRAAETPASAAGD